MKQILLAITLAVAAVTPAHAQDAARAPRRNQITLDAAYIGGSLAYARRTGDRTFVGVEAGAGGDFNGQMLLAGPHLSQDPWLQYGSGDGGHTNVLFDLLHIGVFVRREAGNLHLDAGGTLSLFLHDVDYDDDPGFGFFLGPEVSAYYGWKRVKFGPSLRAGIFTEGNPTEFGIQLSPLTARIVFPF